MPMTRSAVLSVVRTARKMGNRADLRGADLRGANLQGANLWGAGLRGANLQGANLWGADLRNADLRGANLQGANLWGAGLRNADLQGANLQGANLRGADLQGANLQGANLRGADLRGANLRSADLFLRVDGLPSGQATYMPTPDGWALHVGCWTGDLTSLSALIEGDEGWPEAEGDECGRRRPGLRALIAMCEAHEARHEGYIEQLTEKWGRSDA